MQRLPRTDGTRRDRSVMSCPIGCLRTEPNGGTCTMSTIVSDEELVARYPGEGVNHDNQAQYRGWLDHQLLFNRCRDCGTWHDPPKPMCPSCWSTNVAATPVAGTGVIFMAVF